LSGRPCGPFQIRVALEDRASANDEISTACGDVDGGRHFDNLEVASNLVEDESVGDLGDASGDSSTPSGSGSGSSVSSPREGGPSSLVGNVSAGAIAGGVIGGVFGLTLIVSAVYFFRRHRAPCGPQMQLRGVVAKGSVPGPASSV
jgi:hypothetical protein